MSDFLFWFFVCAGCGLGYYLFTRRHDWHYIGRNERVCRACLRQEMMFEHGDSVRFEVMSEGEPGHKCSESSHD